MIALVIGFFDSQLLSAHIAQYQQSKQAKISRRVPALDKNGPPRLIINSIHVNAPVTFETRTNADIFFQDLQRGVVHYPGTALPGQEGNIVIFGQSADQWWAVGHYKFVFTLLGKLNVGNQILLDYQGKRYVYKVYNYTVVSPLDLTSLNQSGSHVLTLITPTPIGTSTNRLVISASQVSPEVGNDFGFDKSAVLPPGALKTLPGDHYSLWHELSQRL